MGALTFRAEQAEVAQMAEQGYTRIIVRPPEE